MSTQLGKTFADRSDAGRRLAAKLTRLREHAPIVLALPRGGVPVGFEIARALAAALDLVLAQKIGAPSQPELAVGAVGDGGERALDEETIARLGITPEALAAATARATAEVERRRMVYRGRRAEVALSGKTAIIVDDGIATGATTRAAVAAVRRRGAARTVLAVPVAAPEALAVLEKEVDEVVCLLAPEEFGAVGAYYDDFGQLSDEDVLELLERARAFATDRRASRA